MMIKLVLVAALMAVVSAQGGLGVGNGFGHGGYGHGHYAVGYGFTAGGGHGGYGGHHHGVAKVQVHQNPHEYAYGVQEHGPHYHKYINQAASTHGHGGYGGGFGGGFGRK